MLLKNINKNDFGMIYLSCLRHCMTKRNKENIEMLFHTTIDVGEYLTKRDFSCGLEDLINGNRYYGNYYDFMKNYNNEDDITLLTHYMLSNLTYFNLKKQINCQEEVNKNILYKTFSELNFFINHNIQHQEEDIESFLKGILKNKNFNTFLKAAKRNFDFNVKTSQKETIEINLTEEEIDFLCKNAIHYAVGRRTYITSIVPNFILSILDNISIETKEYIVKYISELKEKDDKEETKFPLLGDKCDRVSWLNLIEKLKEKNSISFC